MGEYCMACALPAAEVIVKLKNDQRDTSHPFSVGPEEFNLATFDIKLHDQGLAIRAAPQQIGNRDGADLTRFTFLDLPSPRFAIDAHQGCAGNAVGYRRL